MTIAVPAKPGDIFILLQPILVDKMLLHQYQLQLQGVFGGEVYEDIHVTCQRFSCDDEEKLARIIYFLSRDWGKLPMFPVFGARLVAFYADFWESWVVRWEVADTVAWRRFYNRIGAILGQYDCEPHYPVTQTPKCSALTALPEKPTIPTAYQTSRFLFYAYDLRLTRMTASGAFETLAQFRLGSDLANESVWFNQDKMEIGDISRSHSVSDH
ncbi:MAG TPA: hypothetical protein VLL52_05090 [Anaerolineae bacterium]|nr:hypothetical protein [Anaerolineae bacterium]